MAGSQDASSRVTSADSFIPLGPAANTVLLSEDDIVHAVLAKPPRLMSRIRERALNQSPPLTPSRPARRSSRSPRGLMLKTN